VFCFRGIKPIKGICLTNHTHDVHLHTRNRETGKPDHSPAAFAAFPPRIKQSTRCCGKLTSGGAPYMGIEERIQPAIAFKPEFASLNMDSLNFGLFPMLERFRSSGTSWERDYLEAAGIWYSEIPLGMLIMRCRPVLVIAPASLRAGKVKSARVDYARAARSR